MAATRTRDLRAFASDRSTPHFTRFFHCIRVLWIVSLAVLVLAVTAGVAQAAELWSDISDAQWVSDYHVTAAEAATVADGFPDGTFRPYADVTRGQFAKMAVTGLGVDTADPPIPSYSDVPPTHTFYTFIEGGRAAEMIGGYPDGTYRPDNKIMRQQANSILGKYLAGVEIAARGGIQGDFTTYPTLAGWFAAEGQFYLAGYEDESQISTVHRPATAYLVYRQVTLGSNGMLTPMAFLSRAQAVALVLRTVDVAAEVTTPPAAPTDVDTLPVGPSNNTRPYVTGLTIPEGRVAVYDTFGGSTTEIAQGTADADGHFSVRTPALVEGPHSFTTKVKDDTGLISSASAAVAYLLDLSWPVGDITAPADGAGVVSRKPDFTVDASDEGAGIVSAVFEYRQSGSADDYATISTDTTAVGMEYKAAWGDLSLSDGAYEFRVRVADEAGNVTIVGPVDVIVDLKPPTVELKAPASAAAGDVFFTDGGAPLFAAEAKDDPATVGAVASGVDRVDFRYKLKGALPALPANWTAADFTLLSTSHEASALADWGSTVLADGYYVFAVQSFDLAGNASALDTQEVVIDSAPPIVNITAPLTGTKVRGDAPHTITWTATDTYFGTDPIKIEYSANDDGTWPTVLATATANDGSFTWDVPAADVPAARIRITATDAMLRQTVVVSGPFVIDNTPPAAPTGVTAVDNDNVQPGIDGRDFTVNWTPSVSAETGKQRIYILPAATALDLYGPGQAATETIPNNTVATWTGTSSLTGDSTGAPFSATLVYHVYVVAEDSAGNRTASSMAVWPADAPAPPTGVDANDPDATFAGVDGRDFRVWWKKSTSPDVLTHRIYILPEATVLKVSPPGAHTPVATVTDDSVPWVGSDSIQNDSAGTPLAAVAYKVYVVATDDDGRSAWSSAPMTPTAE